jgi:dTDP-4-dehydrorhamnose 3,5-epimerase
LNNSFTVHNLETHQTKDVDDGHQNGDLTVIWRDWDQIIHNPKMIYVNSVNPGEIKGPHIHKNRTSYFYCITGKVVIIIRDNDQYHEVKLSSKDPKLVSVSNQIAAALVNNSHEISQVLVLADVAWKPNDDEMIDTIFDNYDFKKWFLT